ncbi:hypothetical protein [Spongiactinospora sp. TRM90649]|uniref:hypothetical protein n=1 Tax=Spongiactinospora sp. TRM90649 TaxID=3031114 RepID=UPI0023F6E094|nr:hypothetical protein [Spongiactinospora sp. TRM90649]MDF5756606.1 hypothetical protein [Spongiactinospora sp. TRM90649]
MSSKQNGSPPQAVPPEEFDEVVTMIRNDPGLRADIEAVIGRTLDPETTTNRELFNLYRGVQAATNVTNAVARYGRARHQLRRAREELEGTASAEQVVDAARARITEAENRADQYKADRDRWKGAYEALTSGRSAGPLSKPVIRGEVSEQ